MGTSWRCWSERTGVKNRMMKGEAKDDQESFEFTIEPAVKTGYLLTIQYSGDRAHGITGAGVWPSVEKAKEIAQAAATKLLHGATVSWQQISK